MAVTVVQNVWGTNLTGTQHPAFGVNVTTGNTIVVFMIKMSGASTDWLCSDAVNGSYDAWVPWGTYGREMSVARKRNVTGGFTVVDITSAGGTITGDFIVMELAGAHNTDAWTSDTIDETGLTSHVCATTGLTGTGLFVGMGNFGSATDITNGSGWTQGNNTTANGGVIQYKIENGTLEKSPYTTADAINDTGHLSFIPEGPAPPSAVPFLTLLSAKRI